MATGFGTPVRDQSNLASLRLTRFERRGYSNPARFEERLEGAVGRSGWRLGSGAGYCRCGASLVSLVDFETAFCDGIRSFPFLRGVYLASHISMRYYPELKLWINNSLRYPGKYCVLVCITFQNLIFYGSGNDKQRSYF